MRVEFHDVDCGRLQAADELLHKGGMRRRVMQRLALAVRYGA